MPGDPNDVPCTETCIYLLGQRGRFLAKPIDFLGKVEIRSVTHALQLFDFHLEFCNGLFKVEVIGIHS